MLSLNCFIQRLNSGKNLKKIETAFVCFPKTSGVKNCDPCSSIYSCVFLVILWLHFPVLTTKFCEGSENLDQGKRKWCNHEILAKIMNLKGRLAKTVTEFSWPCQPCNGCVWSWQSLLVICHFPGKSTIASITGYAFPVLGVWVFLQRSWIILDNLEIFVKILDFSDFLPRKPRKIKILARNPKSYHWKSEEKITVISINTCKVINIFQVK